MDLLIVQGDGVGPEITRAVDRLIGSPETRTRDLGGRLGTKACAEAVAKAVLDGK